jgi:hemerythrin
MRTHQAFIEKVGDVRTKLLNGQVVLSFEITTFLKDWLTNHIKGDDKAYSKHFNENGLF